MLSSAFRQFNPRQSPRAVTHLRPFLWQEHVFVPHGFLEVSLHLQRTNFSNVSGTGGRSVMIGFSLVPLSLQTHFSGSN